MGRNIEHEARVAAKTRERDGERESRESLTTIELAK